jgi:hypothetical protein
MPGQPGSVGAGALNPDTLDVAVRAEPSTRAKEWHALAGRMTRNPDLFPQDGPAPTRPVSAIPDPTDDSF